MPLGRPLATSDRASADRSLPSAGLSSHGVSCIATIPDATKAAGDRSGGQGKETTSRSSANGADARGSSADISRVALVADLAARRAQVERPSRDQRAPRRAPKSTSRVASGGRAARPIRRDAGTTRPTRCLLRRRGEAPPRCRRAASGRPEAGRGAAAGLARNGSAMRVPIGRVRRRLTRSGADPLLDLAAHPPGPSVFRRPWAGKPDGGGRDDVELGMVATLELCDRPTLRGRHGGCPRSRHRAHFVGAEIFLASEGPVWVITGSAACSAEGSDVGHAQTGVQRFKDDKGTVWVAALTSAVEALRTERQPT